jgi:hypothetical protein
LSIDWYFGIDFTEGVDDEVHDNTFDAQDVIAQWEKPESEDASMMLRKCKVVDPPL